MLQFTLKRIDRCHRNGNRGCTIKKYNFLNFVKNLLPRKKLAYISFVVRYKNIIN